MQDASQTNLDKNQTVTLATFPSVFKEISQSPSFYLERISYLSTRLRHLVAVEGEDNHRKVREFLQSNSEIASELISHKGTMSDAPGCVFRGRSAYGYLFWAGSDLVNILDEFINDEAKKRISQECNHIETYGLEFSCNEVLTVGSKHFDMQPVIKAAFDYDAAANALIKARNWKSKAWEPVRLLWLRLGEELGKVPLWIAQTFCSRISFCPPSSLINVDFERTTLFYNLSTGETDSWYVNGAPNPLLGKLIGIQKVNSDRAWGLSEPPSEALENGYSDLGMLAKMYKENFIKQPKKILIKLASAESDVVEDVGLNLSQV